MIRWLRGRPSQGARRHQVRGRFHPRPRRGTTREGGRTRRGRTRAGPGGAGTQALQEGSGRTCARARPAACDAEPIWLHGAAQDRSRSSAGRSSGVISTDAAARPCRRRSRRANGAAGHLLQAERLGSAELDAVAVVLLGERPRLYSTGTAGLRSPRGAMTSAMPNRPSSPKLCTGTPRRVRSRGPFGRLPAVGLPVQDVPLCGGSDCR